MPFIEVINVGATNSAYFTTVLRNLKGKARGCLWKGRPAPRDGHSGITSFPATQGPHACQLLVAVVGGPGLVKKVGDPGWVWGYGASLEGRNCF